MTRNGRQVISIVLGCGTKKQRTSESIQLLNYAYNNFEVVDIYENMRKRFTLNVEKSKNKTYEININGKKEMLLPIGEKENMLYEYNLKKDMSAPILKGEKIGNIVIKSPKGVIETIEIRLPKSIKRKSVIEYFSKIIGNQLEYVLINV